MLPLAGTSVPTSAESLTAALRGGFEAQGLTPRTISADGDFPRLNRLRLDLTGLALSRTQRLPHGTGTTEGRIEAATLEITAQPLTFEQAPVHLSIEATCAIFDLARSGDGGLVLVLADAAEGSVLVEIQREDLEQMLHRVAADAASEHGVDIKRTQIELVARGPRSLGLQARFTAKMFIVTADLTLRGELMVDDQLNARLSELRFEGEGMIANAAAGFIRPQLARLEGRSFPLMQFALGGLKLRDWELRGGASLRVSARFGSA